MIRAILFDCDGVLADTEPLHLEMFQHVLEGEGTYLTPEKYNESYLGLDDRGWFRAVYNDQGKELSVEKEDQLVQSKNLQLWSYLQGKSLLYEGVKETLDSLRGRFFLGIVSGALRNEIEAVLMTAQTRSYFHVLISAEDVKKGKPDPEGYRKAISHISKNFVPDSEILLPEECLVIEDSPWGIEAAKAAGAHCLAVTTSYPAEKLKQADWIFSGVAGLRPGEIKTLIA